VFDSADVPPGEVQPKGDDADEKLKWTVRRCLKRIGTGDQYRESLEKVVQANWKFVNAIGHRQRTATERDARLAVIYTYLTIWLVDSTREETDAGDEQ
jgi:hypothetical protein